MENPPRQGRQELERDTVRPGLGVFCIEAQADGVPCYELGIECETCERAWRPELAPEPAPMLDGGTRSRR